MTGSLQDDLSALTGEEIYHLANALIAGAAEARSALYLADAKGATWSDRQELWTDITESLAITLAQVARITIPIREAAAIVYRVRYSRNHPVKVPGT